MKTLKADFIKYIALNVMGMLGVSFYILADTFFVAKALGTAGLAALNFSISIFSVIQGFGLMIGIGGATAFSISKHKQKGKHDPAFMHAIAAGLLVSIVCVVVAAFFTTPLSVLLGADAVTLPLTRTYLTTILFFSPFFILNNILLAFIRNDHNPRLSMIGMLVSSCANIVLDYVFIFPCSMGIFGAALATGLSPIISIGILSTHIFRKKHGFYIGKCRICVRKIREIVSFGFSSFIGEIASAISLITFNLIIFNMEGNTGVAAYGIVANIALIATAMFTGIAQGLQPLASKAYGSGDQGAVRQILRYAIITAVVFSVSIYSAVFFFCGGIVSVFNSENQDQLRVLAEEGLKLYFIGYFFAGFNIVSAAFFASTSNTKQAMLVSLLRSSILLVPAVFLFSEIFMITGVWIAFVVTEFLVFLYSIVAHRICRKS